MEKNLEKKWKVRAYFKRVLLSLTLTLVACGNPLKTDDFSSSPSNEGRSDESPFPSSHRSFPASATPTTTSRSTSFASETSVVTASDPSFVDRLRDRIREMRRLEDFARTHQEPIRQLEGIVAANEALLNLALDSDCQRILDYLSPSPDNGWPKNITQAISGLHALASRLLTDRELAIKELSPFREMLVRILKPDVQAIYKHIYEALFLHLDADSVSPTPFY